MLDREARMGCDSRGRRPGGSEGGRGERGEQTDGG